MATTETAAIILKGTTEQNKKLDGFYICSSRESVLFCSVVSFIIILLSVADVSVVAITVSIDKISNRSKTNIRSIIIDKIKVDESS